MNYNLASSPNSRKCMHHFLYSIVYGSLCILLVMLGVVWCTSSHSQKQQQSESSPLVSNLQNHRLSDEPLPIFLNSRPSAAAPIEFQSEPRSASPQVQIEQSPLSLRRSYQSSGFDDYSRAGYGQQITYQQPPYQPYQQYPQGQGQLSSQYMYPPGVGGGSYYPGYGYGSYYPGYNSFLSLYPQRYYGGQGYYPYGGGLYGNYPYNTYGYGVSGPYGSLMRLNQATSLLSGIRNSVRDRLTGLNTGIEGQAST